MASFDSEPFAVVSEVAHHSIGKEFEDFNSAKLADLDIQITQALREHYPELCVTITPEGSSPLLAFAAEGFATAELDIKSESIFRWRGYIPPQHRGGTGQIGDGILFAKYHYQWAGQDYLLYTVQMGILGIIQYILKEPDKTKGECTLSNNAATDALIKECAMAQQVDETDYIYVYDGWWDRSRSLWEQVQKSSWDKVILDSKKKNALKDLTQSFFDSKEIYEKYGVPWKRGIIFHGPPGNGKTISVKALMKDLSQREPPVPTLYVKSAEYTFDIGEVFAFARSFSPCMLVMEDIETIVNQDTRSYFFNEVDGLENNDGKLSFAFLGLFLVATTNFVDRLDPGLSKRPSRFDRKFEFPLPSRDERVQYAEYWRQKIADTSPEIAFPQKICEALADITKKFSFAYIQEAFVASLLTLAREDQDDSDDNNDNDTADGERESTKDDDYSSDQLFAKPMRDDPLDKYRLWRALKTNVKILRDDLKNGDEPPIASEKREGKAPLLPLKKQWIDEIPQTATLRDRAWSHYFSPPNQTDLKRSGTVPYKRSRFMPQESSLGSAAQVGASQRQGAIRRSGTVQPIRTPFMQQDGSSMNVPQANMFSRPALPFRHPPTTATGITSQGASQPYDAPSSVPRQKKGTTHTKY